MEKIDILNRDEFVQQLLRLVENISDNQASTCFAVNGAWGSGKTFVLDLFQEQLEQIQSEETYTDKFFVIQYNCWKFDYYQEPLVAIVASMTTAIEQKVKLFPDSQVQREILGVLKAVGGSLLAIGANAVKEKTGIDVQKTCEVFAQGKKEGTIAYQEDHSYDVYFNFNKALNELSNLLRSLAKQYTVVFLVDELDRCVPEYSIKVMERLHHLTEDQSNIITILSIDKKQLIQSVKQIFGFENPGKYLEKFINFEVKLDYGTISKTICDKYADYIALFDKDIIPFEDPIEECLQVLFKDIDIRSQERIVKKAMLAHQLLYRDRKDYSFMCVELIITILHCCFPGESSLSTGRINLTSFDNIFMQTRSIGAPAFSAFFKEKLESINFRPSMNHFSNQLIYLLPEEISLYAAILFTWIFLHNEKRGNSFKVKQNGPYEPILGNINELKKFVETIMLIS